MPELDRIRVKGFKSIESIDIELGPMSVLIGANGSGKSNFIQVFSFLHAIRQGHLRDYVIRSGGANKILHFGSRETRQLEIYVSFEDGKNQYDISLEPTITDELYPASEGIYFWDKLRYNRPYSEGIASRGSEAGISGPARTSVARYVQERLGRWRLYHFHDTSADAPMKRTADVDDNRFLQPDGSNLAAFLYYLRLKQEASYELIRGTVQQVAPFLDDFLLEPQNLNPNKIRLEWRHKGSEAYFDASSFSDGTLRFIALSTLFLQPRELRPSVILVDEPELGLHPYAITLLASLIQQAAVETQVIVSTQSSLLLDHFEPEDILVTDRVGGGTVLSRQDPDRLASWLERYSLGQLWEKNILEGRPARE